MKKLVSFILALLMLFSFTACQNGGGNSAVGKRDFEIGDTGGLKVPFGNGEEIEVMCIDDVGATNTYIFDKLSQITGLNVKPLLIHKASSSQKTSTIIASGELPDVFYNNSHAKINKYAMEGAFEPINPHLDELPNISRYFGEDGKYPWFKKSYAASDGNFYFLPQVESDRLVNHGMLYRKDVFDKHGIKMWNSPETFYQALKKLKELYPDSYPLTSKTGTQIIKNYAVAWGGIKSFDVYFDETSKVWKYSDTDPKTKEILDFLHKLYDEKLLDPEFLTNTQSAWTQRMTTGKSFVTYDWIGRLDMFMQQSEIDGYDLRYANPIGPKQTLVTLPQVDSFGLCIAKGKNSLLAMKLVDFLYSDAGAELMTIGVRGETFEFDKDGKIVYLDTELAAKDKVEITDLSSKYCMWMAGSYTRVDHNSSYFQYTEREQEAQDWVEKCGGLEPADPVVTFADENSTKVNDLKTKLSKKFEEVMFKYVVGQDTGDKAWENWLKEAKKLGEDELVKFYNDRHKELGL